MQGFVCPAFPRGPVRIPEHPPPPPRDASEGKGPRRRPQRRLGRRLEEVAKAVGGGYCRLQMPLSLGLGVRETVTGHRLGALEGGGGYLQGPQGRKGATTRRNVTQGVPPPFQCIPAPPPPPDPPKLSHPVGAPEGPPEGGRPPSFLPSRWRTKECLHESADRFVLFRVPQPFSRCTPAMRDGTC